MFRQINRINIETFFENIHLFKLFHLKHTEQFPKISDRLAIVVYGSQMLLEGYNTYIRFLLWGPGQYDLKFPQEHRGNLMTTKDRRLKYKNEETPGPGTYEVSTPRSFLHVPASLPLFLGCTIWNFHHYRPRTYVRREVMFSQVCVCSGGEGEGGRYQVSDFRGGVPGLKFSGGVPGLKFSGGVPGLKFFGGGYLVSVKGKLFDTRFGLIHVQTGKNFFCQGTPPPQNSKKLLWLHGGRYASCVHAGGLSCCVVFLCYDTYCRSIARTYWFTKWEVERGDYSPKSYKKKKKKNRNKKWILHPVFQSLIALCNNLFWKMVISQACLH